MADIKYSIFADTAAAERAFVNLEQKVAKLENALTQVSRKSREGSGVVIAGLKNQLGSVVALGAGYLSLGNLVTTAYEATTKLLRNTDEIANKFDVAIRKIRILGNLNELEGDAAQKQIHKTAQKLGFSNTEGTDAARELTSAGFDIKEATGASLESLLKSLAANQEFGENINTGDLARASASYLQSQGQALNGENLERIGVFVKKLADVSTVGIADLQEIAKHGSTLAGKLTQEEQFAAVTALRKEGRPGSEAANALEKVTLSLTGKGDKKKTQEALKEMGLGVGDVDIVGESYTEVMRRLNKGLGGIAPERQDTVLAKLIGVEHIASAKSLITKNAYVEELTQGQNDRAGFDKAVGVATEGRAAGSRRLTAVEESQIGSMAEKYSDEDVKRAFRISDREQGTSPFRTSVGEIAYNVQRGLGRGQEGSIGSLGRSEEHQQRIIQLLEESVKAANEQTGLLKDKAAPQLNRNAQSEPAR